MKKEDLYILEQDIKNRLEFLQKEVNRLEKMLILIKEEKIE